MKYRSVFFLLASIPFFSYSQTSITNNDFEVSDDVLKVVEYTYYNIANVNQEPKVEYISTSSFKNGLIQHQINEGYVSIILGVTEKKYTYLNPNSEYKINDKTYGIFEFGSVKFSNSKKDFKIIKQTANTLEFEFHNGRKIITAKYTLTKNNLIEYTVPDLWFEIKTYYNKKGQIIRILKSESNVLKEETKHSYSDNGLLEKTLIENFSENTKVEKFYEYELDEKGNWIKKIEYQVIPNNYDGMAFCTRRLTYKDGTKSGDILDYNTDNFFTINPSYFKISHPDDKVKGCISGDCQNGLGKRAFGEKDIYEGGFKDGFRHGLGTYLFENGNKYEGNYFIGLMHGNGTYTFANGDLYEGEFKGDQRDGIGTYNFENGNKYEGNWEKGLQHGKGIMYDYIANIKQEAIYKEGKIVEVISQTKINEVTTNNTTSNSKKGDCISGDCQNGVGKMLYINKDIYEGTFVKGLRLGQGKYQYANEDVYYGNFIDNYPNGTGLYLFSSGDVYEGNYKNGIRNGFGAYSHANGNYHYGNWINGQLDGEVTFYDYKIKKQYLLAYKNGTITQTISSKDLSFKEDNPDCIVGDCKTGFSILSTIQDNNIFMLVGNFKNELLDGFGKVYMNEWLTYEGEWVDGKYHGQGTLYTGATNESRCIGEFKNGLMHGFCKMYTAEKIEFEGTYQNNIKNGAATIYDYTNNVKRDVIFKNNEIVKVIKTSEINLTSKTVPNGIVWRKNKENTEFWLYNNKNEITGNIFYLDNNSYFFTLDSKEIYVLENFKQQNADTYYYAKLLPEKFPHGAWLKRNATSLIPINSKGEIIKSNSVFKFAPGGADIIYKGSNETETLLLKNFTNAQINKIYPAEIYTPSTAIKNTTTIFKTPDNTSFQTEINKCKLEENIGSCIFKKFKETYASQKESSADITILEQNTINNLNAIGIHDIGLLFNVLFKSEKELSKLASKLDTDVKVKLKAHSQKIVDDYNKTHTNEVPESLKNSVRKQ